MKPGSTGAEMFAEGIAGVLPGWPDESCGVADVGGCGVGAVTTWSFEADLVFHGATIRTRIARIAVAAKAQTMERGKDFPGLIERGSTCGAWAGGRLSVA